MINLDQMIQECQAHDSVKTVMRLLTASQNTISGNLSTSRKLYVQGSDGNWYQLEVNLSTGTPAASFTLVGKQIPTGA